MSKALKRLLSLVSLVALEELIRKWMSMPPTKYSPEWIKSLTDTEWEKEREHIRLDMCNPQLDISRRTECEKILRLFDKIKSDRDWAGKTPQGPAFHREHGLYLSNDE